MQSAPMQPAPDTELNGVLVDSGLMPASCVVSANSRTVFEIYAQAHDRSLSNQCMMKFCSSITAVNDLVQ